MNRLSHTNSTNCSNLDLDPLDLPLVHDAQRVSTVYFDSLRSCAQAHSVRLDCRTMSLLTKHLELLDEMNRFRVSYRSVIRASHSEQSISSPYYGLDTIKSCGHCGVHELLLIMRVSCLSLVNFQCGPQVDHRAIFFLVEQPVESVRDCIPVERFKFEVQTNVLLEFRT